ncbi:MAG: hypothetical protein IJT24_07930 [Lachnospiraceae bacterium]|nr:hypothetical protein [Lachnospiraceae bacterium]
MMEMRFKSKSKIFDVTITAVGAVFSVGIMLYGVWKLGLGETWPELVLNLFYIAALVLMWMYIFKIRITAMQFNCWCSLCVGATVLLRDILFPPQLSYAAIRIPCRVLSVLMMLMLTFFYARREWETYSKRKLMIICIIDMVIAALYTIDIFIEPENMYTGYLLTEIWIRPAITYGLVACFVSESEEKN